MIHMTYFSINSRLMLQKITILKPFVMLTLAGLFLSSCSTSPEVQYTKAGAVDTITTDFSSTDLKTTVDKMVKQMLSSSRVMQLSKGKSGQDLPVIAPATIKNQTNQHINTQMLSNSMTTKLLNSGQFNLVDMSKVKQVKKQLNYQNQSGMVDPDTASEYGKQIGAQYLLYGNIANIQQRNQTQQTQFFQITMKLMDIENGLIIWQGQNQIRKKATQKTFGW